MKKKHLITAALPYTNGPVHIGHVAGCYLPADTYVRYLRTKGEEVLFISGTDEHGVPIMQRATKEGTTPQAIVDKYHTIIADSFASIGINFDIFSRTTNPIHYATSQEFFKTMVANNAFVEIETEQYFDEIANEFLSDRYIMGTCPKCANANAYGDQCEKCGSTLQPTDLINPISKLSAATPILRKTTNWFLPLDKQQTDIQNYIHSITDWKTNVKGQCQSWLDGGLQPRAMTRDLKWGIPVPISDATGKVLYVWFEAPIGYISATKHYFATTNNPDGWKDWWQDKNTNLVHFIGKDNIVFHCIIFPAMLMAHGNYILPRNVAGNEFLNLEGQKISTSRNYAVWLEDYLIDFPNKIDELRYVLTAIAPETKDADFTWKDFQSRINNELVAVLGNFINRVLSLIHKYYEGVIPQNTSIQNTEINIGIQKALDNIEKHLDKYEFRFALNNLMEIARIGNKYLADQEPWKKDKITQTEEIATTLTECLQIVQILQVGMQIFLPNSATRLATFLNTSTNLTWQDIPNLSLSKGNILAPISLLFTKITDEEISLQIEKLNTISQK